MSADPNPEYLLSSKPESEPGGAEPRICREGEETSFSYKPLDWFASCVVSKQGKQFSIIQKWLYDWWQKSGFHAPERCFCGFGASNIGACEHHGLLPVFATRFCVITLNYGKSHAFVLIIVTAEGPEWWRKHWSKKEMNGQIRDYSENLRCQGNRFKLRSFYVPHLHG